MSEGISSQPPREPSFEQIHSVQILGKKSSEEKYSQKATSSMNRFIKTPGEFLQKPTGSVEQGTTGWLTGKGSFEDFIESIKGINQQYE